MNILHLVSYAVFSGPLPPTVQLARAQRALGHRVWVAHDTLRGAFSPYEEGADGPLHDSGVMLPHSPLGLSPKAGLRQLARDRTTLRRLVDELALDIVHTHLSHDHTLVALAGLAAARPGRRPVGRAHTVHAPRQLSLWPHRRWLWRHTDALVVRSPADETAVHRVLGARASHVPVATIPAAIDPAQWTSQAAFTPDGARRLEADELPLLQALPAEAPLFVQVALMAGRGQRELLEAWAVFADGLLRREGAACREQLPHLALVGDGPQRGELEQRRDALGLAGQVHFPGYLHQRELRAVYARASGAFVAQAGNDAGARAGLEALAAGLALIAVQMRPGDALGELVAQGRGHKLGDRRVETLVAALRKWWEHDARRGKGDIGIHSWLVEARSPRLEAERTLALYRRSRHGIAPNLARAAKHRVDGTSYGA